VQSMIRVGLLSAEFSCLYFEVTDLMPSRLLTEVSMQVSFKCHDNILENFHIFFWGGGGGIIPTLNP
jgi:hypothetical protein